MKDARGNQVSSWRYYMFPGTHATRSTASTSARGAYKLVKGHIAKIAAVCEALAKKDVADSTGLLNAAEKLVAAIDDLVVAFQASSALVRSFEDRCFKEPRSFVHQARREKLAVLQDLQGKLHGILQRMEGGLTSLETAPQHDVESKGKKRRCQEQHGAEGPSAEATTPFLTPCSSAGALASLQ